ncbi:MAG: NAD(P)/FAD-dependent oxidoreductase [Pseudomonadota bacterium]
MDVDYLIIGAGTTGICFADQLFTDTDATIAIVDRRGHAGGHWVDTYPFVELHQPASYYGVPSAPLGTDRVDTEGPNAGLHCLASGTEVTNHFQTCLRERLLPSGRVHYFPLHEVTKERTVKSLLGGGIQPINVRKKVVNAAYHQNAVPKTHPPKYEIAPEAAYCPPNDLPRLAPFYQHFLIVGGGKTAIDTCLFLLKSGADPDLITWIVPRDSWLINRRTAQSAQPFFGDTIGGFASMLEAMAEATSADDFALRQEEAGNWLRVDKSVMPRMFHAATVTELEIEMLQKLHNIVRMGRVKTLEPHQVILDGGSIQLPVGTLAVDCTASAISIKEQVPMFQGDEIVCQLVRFPSVSFSATLIAHLEANLETDEEKNALAKPVPLPDTPHDFFKTTLAGFMNAAAWRDSPLVSKFLRQSRLDPFSSVIAEGDNTLPERKAILERMQAAMMPAAFNMQKLIAEKEAA